MDVFEIKVTLQDIQPLIWRRIQVPADIRLGKFHRVLQATMGGPTAICTLFASAM